MIHGQKINPSNPLQQKLPIKPNSIQSDIVTVNDFMPTILSITGTSTPSGTYNGWSMTLTLTCSE
ncbi:hypothetical protein [Rubritalea tangerina]|uniref:hypothetical protein n=1 Tax=Rubritalea tangerina TaxID=430798 RepID=UPI003618D715